MRRLLPLIFLFSTFLAYTQQPASYVNPFVGTRNMGHTFPGAVVPFGFVQLSPDTKRIGFFNNGKYNPQVYRYCAGYQYDDTVIVGFSHTHFSGTGHSDLGDLLFLPVTGNLRVDKLSDLQKYFSVFSHEHENAIPGFYSVYLKTYGITASLTATEHCGFHKYVLDSSQQVNLLIDLTYNIYNYPDKNTWTFVRVENDSTITGFRLTHGWARTRYLFFAIRFSQKIKTYQLKRLEKVTYDGFYRHFDQTHNFPEIAGKQVVILLHFPKTKRLLIKVGLSGVSTDGALKNLNYELPSWNFDSVRQAAFEQWNKELSKIKVQTMTVQDKITFYTALYHTFMAPVIFQDVDSLYRGLDQNIHKAKNFTNYTIFSLWDTYRALHPLFNLIQASRNNDFVWSMYEFYRQSVHQMLPVWAEYANETWCMIGYHAVSVIADALQKGTTDLPPEKALQAAVSTSNVPYYGQLSWYKKLGYVPADKTWGSVSKTLEYAYDDWCIAQIAQKAQDTAVEKLYLKRSKNYRNVFDKSVGFMRPKLSNGQWRKDFSPLATWGQGFVEGNAWNYTLYVPQDIPDLVRLLGGKKALEVYLDTLFQMHIPQKYFAQTEDVTREGMIGGYDQGNEPAQHVPYLYDWTEAPWKTQRIVRRIMTTLYKPTPDGLCGNDDLGQMSAWYVFSALGFYPVLPGADWYAIGSPLVKSAEIKLSNGRKLHIIVHNQGQKNFYIRKIKFNGRPVQSYKLYFRDLTKGGTLEFFMSNKQKAKLAN